MTKEELVDKWISDMIKHNFMSGWMGDKSEQFKKQQYNVMMKVLMGDIKLIGGNYRLLAIIHSDYGNLKQYCGWKAEELKELLGLFGFRTIQEVIAVMGCNTKDRDIFMENGKLKKEVKFHLIPEI